jgi:Ser/Thr protein kinase RdoA (MazF antagonist)
MGHPIEATDRPLAEIACAYDLSSAEGWRWIKEGGSPAVALFRADGRRYVARVFADEADCPRAGYIAELALHLGSVGISVEEVVCTASGQTISRLSGGMPVILSQFYPDPPLPVPFDAGAARAWGRYVAGTHAACRDWRPPGPLRSPWLFPDPAAVLDRALALAEPLRESRDILERATERIVGCWGEAPRSQPTHGDLWPGNLLRGPDGLRAIDFAQAGDGPRTIDLATAFRWMPWRDDPARAAPLWDAWLAGCGEVEMVPQAELDSVPPVACLQHLVWMVAEVSASNGVAESLWYVEDHCCAVRALLTATT